MHHPKLNFLAAAVMILLSDGIDSGFDDWVGLSFLAPTFLGMLVLMQKPSDAAEFNP